MIAMGGIEHMIGRLIATAAGAWTSTGVATWMLAQSIIDPDVIGDSGLDRVIGGSALAIAAYVLFRVNRTVSDALGRVINDMEAVRNSDRSDWAEDRNRWHDERNRMTRTLAELETRLEHERTLRMALESRYGVAPLLDPRHPDEGAHTHD